MCKTFACKYRTTARKIKEKYVKGKDFTVVYETKSGIKEQVFYNDGYIRKVRPKIPQAEVLPQFKRYNKQNSLSGRIRKGVCDMCGIQGQPIEIHQIKKLKDLTGQSEWENVMRKKRRKTLAVCNKCHQLIHGGNYC